MVKRLKYFARGLVLCEMTDGTRQNLPMVELEANSYIELMGTATIMLLRNTLIERGLWFDINVKELVGAVLDIKIRTTIEIDDENYVSSKLIFDSIGDLSIEQYEELQGELLFKFNGK